jgi:hypothetical protein
LFSASRPELGCISQFSNVGELSHRNDDIVKPTIHLLLVSRRISECVEFYLMSVMESVSRNTLFLTVNRCLFPEGGRYRPLFRGCRMDYVPPHLVVTYRNVTITVSFTSFSYCSRHVSCSVLVIGFEIQNLLIRENYLCMRSRNTRSKSNAILIH